MSAHSSTSSSEHLDPAPHGTGILLWCVGWLCLARAVLGAWEPAWQDREDILNATEYLRQADEKDLRVVVLGSSRMHSAFHSETWAARAGLESDQVANLSVDNGQFWDARFMLDRTGGLPDSVELVVIEAPRWNFNRNKVSPVWGRHRYDYPEHFRQQGGLVDRWSVDDVGDRAALLLEFAWPLYQRRPVEEWADTFRTPPRAVPRLRASVHWFEAQHAKLRAIRALQADSIVLDHFSEPAMSSFAQRNFDLLLREVEEHAARVVLVTLPTRGLYQDMILSDPARREFVASVDATIASHVDEDVAWVLCARAAACGLDEGIFVDYGHLTLDGARALTSRLFDRVGKDGGSGGSGGSDENGDSDRAD